MPQLRGNEPILGLNILVPGLSVGQARSNLPLLYLQPRQSIEG
jgi:hypothetical protein